MKGACSRSLLSQLISSKQNKTKSPTILSRDFSSNISSTPNIENLLPSFSHTTHFKFCNNTSRLLLLNRYQNTPSRNLNTLFEKMSQLSSKQRKIKETTDILEQEFETVEEIIKAFEEVESGFDDENDPKLGLACLKVGIHLDEIGEQHEKVLEFANRALGILDKAENESLSVAMTLHIMSSACFNLKRFDDSLGYLNRANVILRKLEAEGYSDKDVRPVLHAVQLELANTKTAMGQKVDALVNHKNCLEIKEMVLDPESKELGVANRQLAEAYVAVMYFKEALPYGLKALQIHRDQLGDSSVEVVRDRRLLEVIYTKLEEYQGALEQNRLSRRVLNKWGPYAELLRAELDAANLLIALGNFEEAINTLKNVFLHTDRESKTRALAFIAYGNALCNQEKISNSKKCLERARGILDKKESAMPIEVADAYMKIARVYETMNEFETAVTLLKRTLTIFEKLPQVQHLEARASARLGLLLKEIGKVPQAIPYLEKAVELLKESFGSKHLGVGFIYYKLGAANLELERTESATQMYAIAKEIMVASKVDAFQNLPGSF